MKKLTIFAAIVAFAATTACNTIEGVGRDVESVGDTVADEAGN